MIDNDLLLVALLTVAVFALGSIWFGRFELETPRWRRTLKFVLFTAVTGSTTAFCGFAAGAALLALATAGGLAVHFTWCRRNGIDPWNAEPWARYRELRGWRP